MPLEAIQFNDDIDQCCTDAYEYFLECERKSPPAKVREIKKRLKRSDSAVYRHIRLHWNEFISVNLDKPEYIVEGLKGYPKEYFVLACRYNQAKHFPLFQKSLEKHAIYTEHVRKAEAGEEGISQLLLFDGVPLIVSDERQKYPERVDSLERDTQIDDETSDTSVSEDEGVEIELLTKMEDTSPLSPVYMRLILTFGEHGSPVTEKACFKQQIPSSRHFLYGNVVW